MNSANKALFEAVAAYTPRFLVEERVLHPDLPQVRGQFLEGTLLLADISGFTAISEGLSKLGKEGSEELTNIISRFFTHILGVAYSYGGDNLKFAGDSTLVLFSGPQHNARAIRCALKMQKTMKDFYRLRTSAGTFSLSMHVGINSGEFFWATLGSQGGRLSRIIAGHEVNRTAEIAAMASAHEVFVADSTLGRIRARVKLGRESEGCHEVSSLTGSVRTVESCVLDVEPSGFSSIIDALMLYLPDHIESKLRTSPGWGGVQGEHRRITAMFVNLIGCSEIIKRYGKHRTGEITDILNQYFLIVRSTVTKYGGLFVGCDIDTKGDKLLIVFGAPIAHEDDDERAVLCGLELKSRLAASGLPFQQRIGINSGYAYSGEIGCSTSKEYTVMGDQVNLAARLMGIAEVGQMLISHSTYLSTSIRFIFGEEKHFRLKGIQGQTTAHEVTGTKEISTRLRRVSDKELIGRADEIEVLHEILERVLAGQSQFVAITGVAGIGKSRLMKELELFWIHRSGLSLRGNCQSYGAGIPYLPWTELLTSFFHLKKDDSPDQWAKSIEATVADIDPELRDWTALIGSLLNVPVPESQLLKNLDPGVRHQRLLRTVAELLVARAKQTPLLLLLEDLQWADEASIELLNFVSRNVSGQAVFFCVTYRPTEGFELDVERQGNYTKLTLDELPSNHSLDLVRSLLGVNELPQKLSDFVLTKSGGNPFYLEQSIRSLIDTDRLKPDGQAGRYRLVDDLPSVEVPDTIQGVIMARLDQLDDLTKDLLRIGSVIGRTFQCEVVKQIYPRPITDIELVHRFDDLTGLGLILLEKEGPLPEYSFKHILTQEVAYDSTLFAWRREVHQKVAGYFEERYADNIEAYCELLCHHYSKANNKVKTLEYSAKSGDKAKRIFANQEAIKYYHNALEVAPAVTGSNLLANKIRENLGDICELTGQYDRAIESYQAGQQGYVTLRRMLNLRIKNRASTLEGLAVDLPSIQDINRRIAILYGKRGMVYERKGNYGTALHWLDKGLAILPEECEDLAHLYTDRAGVLYRLGRHSEALDWCQRGLHIAQNINDLSSIAHLSYLLGTIHADLGNIQQAIDLRLESLRIYQSIDHLPGQAVVHNNLGVAFYYRGDWKTCRQHYEEGLALYTRIGDVQGMAMVSNNLGEVLSDQGEFNEAIEAFQRCLETWSSIGYSIGVLISHNNLGRAYTRTGQWQIAVDHLNQSINLIEKMETRGILAAEAYQRLAEAHLCAGDPRLTLQLCEQSLSLAEQAQLVVVKGVTQRVMGQAYRHSKQWEKAKESLLTSERFLRERSVIHELCQTLWELVLLDYDCYMERADFGHLDLARSKQQLEEAVDIFQKLGIKYDTMKVEELRAYCESK